MSIYLGEGVERQNVVSEHVLNLCLSQFLQRGSGAAERGEILALSLNTCLTVAIGLKLLLVSAVTFGEKRELMRRR